MADNDTLPATGDVIRSKDRSGVKTQLFGQDLNPGGVSEVLMTAAALADTTSNPTIPGWASMGMVFNGSTWDRARGDTTSGAWVNVKNSLVDNAGFTDGTSIVFPAGFIFDEVAGTALTENDVAAARIDSKRATINVIEDATTRGRRVTVTAAGELTITGSVTSAGSDSTPSVHRNVRGVTATLSSQTDQATSVQLLASNSARLGATIVNDSTAILYLKFGTTASIAAGGYNYKLQPDDTLEMPSGGLPLYTGRIDAIWSADASGWAAVTEYS